MTEAKFKLTDGRIYVRSFNDNLVTISAFNRRIKRDYFYHVFTNRDGSYDLWVERNYRVCQPARVRHHKHKNVTVEQIEAYIEKSLNVIFPTKVGNMQRMSEI